MKNRTTLSLLFTVLPLFVIAQPTAEFSVDVSTGCEPLIVQFINNSTGNNLSYLWDFGNGNTSTDLNPMHDYPNAGTYSPCLTVTDDQGQQDSYCLPNPIEVYPSYHDTLSFTICQGDTILFGGVEYSSQGQYSFPYTTLMGCDSIIELHLSHYPNPTTMDTVYLCPGQACYTYVNGNCYEVGNHNLVFGSSNGCDSTVILTVQEVQAGGVLTLANIDTQEPSCFGESDGSICVELCGGQPPYSYTWNTGATSACITSLSAGAYIVTASDSNGDSIVLMSPITQPPMMNIFLEVQNVSCYAGSDGAIQVTIFGGTPPYTISPSPPLTNLAAGFYTITATDDNGCSIISSPAEVTEPEELTLTPLISEGCDSDTIDLIISGGTSPYSYTWSNGTAFPQIVIPSGETYMLTITDANACTIEDIFENPPSPQITIVGPPGPICRGESTTLEVIPLNGETITAMWTPTDGLANANVLNPIASPLMTTTYTVLATDATTGCEATATLTLEVLQDCVWPGDTDTNKVVNHFDLLNIGLAYDSTGPSRPNASILWDGQEAPDWSQTISAGPNYKHIDCDGNGWINSDDTLAITDNWGQMHNFTGGPLSEFVPHHPTADGAALMIPFYVQPDTLIEGANMVIPVILGEEANPAVDIYGLAFSIHYDTAVIVEQSVSMGFDPSWLGQINTDMISIQQNFPNEGRIDVALTRIDGQAMTDYGQLSAFFITVEDDILFAPDGSGGEVRGLTTEAVFSISGVLALNSSGEQLQIVPTETTAPIGGTSAADDIDWGDFIQVFPNPSHSNIHIKTSGLYAENVKLYDVRGRLVYDMPFEGQLASLPIGQLPAGIYLLRVQTSLGLYMERVLKW